MTNNELLADVRRLEGVLNRRIYGLENAKDKTADITRWERYLKDFASASTQQKEATRFHFDPSGKTGKELENSLRAYKQKLEYARESKSRISDIKDSYRKAKETFEKKHFGGRKMTWKQYNELTKLLDEGEVEYLYAFDTLTRNMKKLNIQFANEEKLSDRKYFDMLIEHMRKRDKLTDIIQEELEKGNLVEIYEN